MKFLSISILLFLCGCSSFQTRPSPFIELRLVHNMQGMSDEILKDKSHDWCRGDGGCRWMGSNPRGWIAIGFEWDDKVDCPTLTTGTSLAVGAPFKQNKPELYWSTLSCGKRWGGKK